jgi:NADPH-dependent curcumin reductase CurA
LLAHGNTFLRAVTCTHGWRALSCSIICRAAEAISALAGWVRAGKIKNKIGVRHGLENAPATVRRLFEDCNEGKQLPRVAE